MAGFLTLRRLGACRTLAVGAPRPKSDRLLAGWLALCLAGPVVAADDYLYTTRPGDTLIGIANRLLAEPTQWPRLRELNRVAIPRQMQPNQVLRIPLDMLARDPLQAEVSAVHGEARTAGSALRVGQRLSEGEALSTGAQGSVSLQLVDGSRLTLQPSSRLKLERLSRLRHNGVSETRLKLEAGRVESRVMRLPEQPPHYLITTPTATMGVRGTEFRAAADADGGSRTEVGSGAVAVLGSAGQQAVAVNAGFGLRVDKDGRAGPPVGLLPAPDLQAIAPVHDRLVVHIAFPTVAGAAAYRMQIGTEAELRSVLAEVSSAVPEARFEQLDDGDYVLRVRAIDVQGLEGQDAQTVFRLKARPQAPFAVSPVDGQKLRAEALSLAWTQSPGAERYRLQIATEPGFAQPLLDQDIAATDWSGKLSAGDYHWRLRSLPGSGEAGPWGVSQRVALRTLPGEPLPAQVAAEALNFAWPGEAGQSFLFQLSSESRFSSLLNEQRLNEPRASVPRPPAGRVYMRVQATDADGYVGPWIAQSVEVPAKPVPPPPETRSSWWLLLFCLPLL